MRWQKQRHEKLEIKMKDIIYYIIPICIIELFITSCGLVKRDYDFLSKE